MTFNGFSALLVWKPCGTSFQVGNAAEHLTAVTVATKDKMDLSLGVALGSSTQIALFVVPFTVIVGWSLGVPMDLNFRSLDVSILLLTVL